MQRFRWRGMERGFAQQADQRIGMDQECARHGVGRDQHDRKDDTSSATAGERAEHDRVDQVGHAEQVPRDCRRARIWLSGNPPVGDERRKKSRQDVADARRDREDPRQLPLEISDEEHAAEDPERLDADQPMLRDAADDRAERPGGKKEVASGKRRQQRNGDAGASVRKTSFAASSMTPTSQATSTAADPTVQRSRRDFSPGRARMPTYRPIQYSVEAIDWMITWRRMSVIPPLPSWWRGRSRPLGLACGTEGRRSAPKSR